MADEALPLQFLKRDRHTGSPHAQHDRQELVRERDLVAVYAVVGHQQPARQTLIDRTATVCQGGLRGLDHETVDVVEEHPVQCDAGGNRLAQFLRRQPLSSATNLHIGFVCGTVAIAQDYRHARHAFTADDADLDGLPAVGNHRGHPAVDEVDLVNPLLWRLQLLAHWKLHRLEVRLQQT